MCWPWTSTESSHFITSNLLTSTLSWPVWFMQRRLSKPSRSCPNESITLQFGLCAGSNSCQQALTSGEPGELLWSFSDIWSA